MTNATTQPPTPQNDVAAVLWSALGKVASKEGERDALTAGSRHCVQLEVVGTVDQQPLQYEIDAVLNIGHDQQRASSITPDQAHLVANVLAKLNPTTRNKILRELPERFAEAGGKLPEVSEELLAATTQMLKRLRAKKTVKSHGPVRCEYRLGEPAAPPTIPFASRIPAGHRLSSQSPAVG